MADPDIFWGDKDKGGVRQEGPEKGWGKQGGLGRSPSGVLGGSPRTVAPQGDFVLTEGGALMPILHCSLVRVAKKSYESAHEKVAPSQTHHKNATKAGHFDRELAEAKQGGALVPAFKSRTTLCAPPGQGAKIPGGEREREPGSTVGSKYISVKKPSEPEHG